jgi:DNA-binding LytR/AlgR family response regulator
MIKIAICDDEEKELIKTNEMCSKYANLDPEYDIRLQSFTSPVELLKISLQEAFDIILLDIYMPGMTGTQLARSLREKNAECQIVFLTTSSAHAVEAFSLHAAHYLVKPYTKEQFEDALTKAVCAVEKLGNAQIILKTPDGLQKILFSELLYSETEKHVQKLHLSGGRCLPIRMSCGELYEQLSFDDRFYKCGSTYIINLGKIQEVSSQCILFDNGEKIPMQRRQYKELLDLFTGYALGGNS